MRGIPADDPNLTPEIVDQIPGTQTDRKTPLGELNWVFTAITDTIAWNVLPRPLFQASRALPLVYEMGVVLLPVVRVTPTVVVTPPRATSHHRARGSW